MSVCNSSADGTQLCMKQFCCGGLHTDQNPVFNAVVIWKEDTVLTGRMCVYIGFMSILFWPCFFSTVHLPKSRKENAKK